MINADGECAKLLTNSAHDTGVVSEGEREIAHRNWWCNFHPATARIKPSERHIGRPKPAICEASVSAATMTDISESSDRRTQRQPIAGSTWRLPERVCVRCCVQHRAHNLLTGSMSARLLANRLTDILESSDRRMQSQPIAGSTWRLPGRVCVR